MSKMLPEVSPLQDSSRQYVTSTFRTGNKVCIQTRDRHDGDGKVRQVKYMYQPR